MSNTTVVPDINVEIISSPALKDMTITQVGQNMFSLNLNIITVVRFPSSVAIDNSNQVTSLSAPTLVDNSSNTDQLRYTDGTTPEQGGEIAAFSDFSTQHGYPPQSREVLAEWVKLQQGGA